MKKKSECTPERCPLWFDRGCIVHEYADFGAQCRFYVAGRCTYNESELKEKTDKVLATMSTQGG